MRMIIALLAFTLAGTAARAGAELTPAAEQARQEAYKSVAGDFFDQHRFCAGVFRERAISLKSDESPDQAGDRPALIADAERLRDVFRRRAEDIRAKAGITLIDGFERFPGQARILKERALVPHPAEDLARCRELFATPEATFQLMFDRAVLRASRSDAPASTAPKK